MHDTQAGMMYCKKCRTILIEFYSHETESYTGIWNASLKETYEFVDRSIGYNTNSEYICSLCDGNVPIKEYQFQYETAKFLYDYAKEKHLLHLPFKVTGKLFEAFAGMSVTQAQKILMQEELGGDHG
jgi:hypothetical protein